MSPTHLATGLALATPLAVVAPEFAVAGAIGGLLGGAVPDFDLFAGEHRRSLHFPVYYWVPALGFGVVALLAPGGLAVGAALLFASAAVHSIADWFGAGNEPRPWNRTSDRAVYVHALGHWLPPKYWVRYDGAPEDLLLTVVLSVPALIAFDGVVRGLALAGIALGAVYVAFRKRVPDLVGV
jgi:hypothetical protein